MTDTGYPLDIVTWFVPGVVLSLIVGLLAARPVARATGERWWICWLLVSSLGVILSATLTPIAIASDFADVAGRCDLRRDSLISLAALQSFNDVSLNVLLFVPLGLAIGAWQGKRWRTGLLLAAVAFPFAIETIQLLAPILGRSCQSGDVIDNLTGLTVGLVLGSVVRWVVRRVHVRAEAPPPP